MEEQCLTCFSEQACILVQVKPKCSVFSVLIVVSDSSRQEEALSLTQHGWSSLSLKELPCSVRVSWRGWDRFSYMDITTHPPTPVSHLCHRVQGAAQD